ncbi:MAG TPA: hypothetical protein VM925_15475 [Labilithrix sp.]|nr:hypothetical protein [Labilithrix sp.]
MRLRTVRLLSFFFLSLASAAAAGGCSSEAPNASAGEQDVSTRTDYEISFAEYNAIYGTSFANAEDAFKLKVTIGDKTISAPTHLFGEAVNVIPYSNEDNVRTADGQSLARGDAVIATVYKPGEVGIAVKHHRSEHPALDFNTAKPNLMKEHFKLQDTHIEVVVGVKRDGKDGAVTLNNPQSYEDGLFGDEEYAMIFLKPVYPAYLAADQIKAFENNVRTLLVGFNAVTDFPGDYNGGDPLGARDPSKVREYVKQMVLAINGDEAARAWFKDKQNQVYCAELAFIAFSAGLITPLNDATMEPLVGAKEWKKFQEAIEKHNSGESTAFTELNDNPRVKYIRDLAVAPAALKPAAAYGPAGEDKKLALQPLTMSDILDEFLRTHIPREHFGEALAPAQAAVLQAMKPGLLEQMRMNQLPTTDPRRAAVEALYDKVVQTVGKSYADYAAYRAELEPLLQQARAVTGPRDDSGEGLFVPPSLFHVAAQGKRAGLLKFQYEGHGVHVSAVKRRSTPAPEPTPVDRIPAEISCAGQCGGMAAGGCYCDARCTTNPEACCADVGAVCR